MSTEYECAVTRRCLLCLLPIAGHFLVPIVFSRKIDCDVGYFHPSSYSSYTHGQRLDGLSVSRLPPSWTSCFVQVGASIAGSLFLPSKRSSPARPPVQARAFRNKLPSRQVWTTGCPATFRIRNQKYQFTFLIFGSETLENESFSKKWIPKVVWQNLLQSDWDYSKQRGDVFSSLGT